MTCWSWLSTEPGVKHLLKYNLRSLHSVKPEGRAEGAAWQREDEAQRERKAQDADRGSIRTVCRLFNISASLE